MTIIVRLLGKRHGKNRGYYGWLFPAHCDYEIIQNHVMVGEAAPPIFEASEPWTTTFCCNQLLPTLKTSASIAGHCWIFV